MTVTKRKKNASYGTGEGKEEGARTNQWSRVMGGKIKIKGDKLVYTRGLRKQIILKVEKKIFQT